MRRFFLWALIAASVLLIVAGVVLLSRFSSATDANGIVPATPANSTDIPRISVQELHTALQSANPPLVWEFRTPETYAQAHVPGSRLLTLGEIEAAARTLDKSERIITLCA